MNDCLPQRSSRSQRVPPAIPRADSDVFARAFADDPELAQLSYPARRILAMSAALFYERGAAATSVRDITRSCGLSPGALYNHFASKDDVLYRLVHGGHERLERRIATALAAVGDDPVERTGSFVRAYVTGHLVQPQLAQLIRREYLHLSAPRYQEIVHRRRALREQLAGLLRDGADAGRFDLIGGRDAPTRVAVMTLDMCSRTSDWYDPSRADPPAELAERYVIAAWRLAGARPR